MFGRGLIHTRVRLLLHRSSEPRWRKHNGLVGCQEAHELVFLIKGHCKVGQWDRPKIGDWENWIDLHKGFGKAVSAEPNLGCHLGSLYFEIVGDGAAAPQHYRIRDKSQVRRDLFGKAQAHASTIDMGVNVASADVEFDERNVVWHAKADDLVSVRGRKDASAQRYLLFGKIKGQEIVAEQYKAENPVEVLPPCPFELTAWRGCL